MLTARRRFVSSLGIILFFLAGCGSTAKTDAVTCTQQFWNGSVGVCIPSGWEEMNRERLDMLGVPPEAIVAFQTVKPVSGQFPNVTLTAEPLAGPFTSSDYSKSSIRSVASLPGYQLVDTRPATIDGKSVSIHIYTAQPAGDQPRVRFYQLSAVSGEGAATGTGYTVTGFSPLSPTDTLDKQILLILQSLTFTEKKK